MRAGYITPLTKECTGVWRFVSSATFLGHHRFTMRTLSLVTALFVLSHQPAARVVVPAGVAVLEDGNVSAGEWAKAVTFVQSGAKVHLQHHQGDLLLAVESSGTAITNVCIGTAAGVQVLHSSASLGTARYRFSGSESWRRTESFEWQRPTDSTARFEHYQAHGWVASTASAGDRTREFRIAKRLLGDSARVTISVSALLSTPTLWPADGAADDLCRGSGFAFGATPDSARFDVAKWLTLVFVS
jgi:hypothetical protein